MIARRGFFKTLAAMPLAVKAAADKAMAEVSGLGHIDGLGAPSHFILGGGGIPAETVSKAASQTSVIRQWIKTFGLPEHEIDRFRDETRYVYSLEPDIACKRSWSMNVKILAQRQRNLERRIKQATKSLDFTLAKEQFQKLWGWDYWF